MKQPLLSCRIACFALAALLLGGCARVNETGLRLVSTKADAFLVINAQILTGTVVFVPDRTGRVSFAKDQGDISSCSGALRYTATSAGEVDLRCNDGTEVALHFTLLSETKGYGYGTTSQGTSSIAFGLSDADALAFLKVPPGKKIAPRASDGALELQ